MIGELLYDFGRHERCASEDAGDEHVPNRRPSAELLERANGHQAEGGGDGAGAVDDRRHRAERARVAPYRGVLSEVGSDRGGDDVVGTTHKDAHETKEEEQEARVHRVGVERKGPQ